MGWARNAGESADGGGQSLVRFRRGVKAKITNGSAVLLVKERHSDGTPFWTLPGGGIRSDESRVEALRREMREELDCGVHIRAPAGRVWYAHDSEIAAVSEYVVMDCELTSRPSPNPVEGVHEHLWARPGTLPPRTLPQVRRFL